MRKFKHLVFAGTFDRLHIGHKKLLDKAFELGEIVSIGITTEKLYNSKPLAHLISTWQVRKRAVEEYLHERNWLKRARFFKLDDIYGPAIIDSTMDSILVTELTKANVKKINKTRVKKELPALKIIVVPLVRGDDGEVVTSERIRMGEMDREGKKYQISNIKYQKELILPKNLREELRKPLGKVISGSESQLEETAKKVYRYIDITICPMVIAVGDIVTMSMLKIGFDPEVKIIDLRSRRKEIIRRNHNFLTSELASRQKSGPVAPRLSSESEGSLRRSLAQTSTRFENFDCSNKQGTVNLKTSKVIQQAIKKFLDKKQKSWIVVNGEEDLLALPAILLAPLHSVVLYGQIDIGVIVVDVTEEKKREVEGILGKFI